MLTDTTHINNVSNDALPLFVLDQKQRVVEWNERVASLIGIPAAKAIGQPCYALLRGKDDRDHLVCRENCAIFVAIQKGHLTGSSTFNSQRTDASVQRLTCTLSAFPHSQHGALGRLSNEGTSGNPVQSAPSESNDQIGTMLQALLALANLTASLSSEQFNPGLEHALDLLREATGADSAELFLVEPISRDMILTAYRGPFWQSFCQFTRFAPGHGLPGRVMDQGKSIVSTSLPLDTHFVREEVKRKGYRAYICVPLFDAHQIIGSVCLGSRQENFATEDALRLLTWSSAPLAMALHAGLLQTSLGALPPPPTSWQNRQEFERFLGMVLQQARFLTNADAGTLTIFTSKTNANDILARVADGIDAEISSCIPPDKHARADCPALCQGHGEVLWGPQHDWAPPCRHVHHPGSATYCLPMQHQGENIGLIQLIFRDTAPLPPTRYVGLLLEFSAQAAAIISLMRTTIEQLPPSEEASQVFPRSTSQHVVATPAMQIQPLIPPDSEPFLRIRCFGSFEMLRNGKPIPNQAFKRRKALTMLKVLLLHAYQPVVNETLVEWLWPESDPKSGLNRLHGIAHALRDVVEPTSRSDDWQIIRTDDNRYLYCPLVPCWLDIAEFDALMTTAKQAEAEGHIPQAISAYTDATSLYRGDIFADDPFADWCLLEREYFRETYLLGLQRLGNLQIQSGQSEQAIASYRQILRTDPLRESMQKKLIEYLADLGRRDEALQQYDRFATQLQRELGLQPLPETQQFIQSLRVSLK